MKKVLVIGGNGFLGSAIVNCLLQHDYAVKIFCRRPLNEWGDAKVEILSGDILDATAVELACKDVDVVFHVASKVAPWGEYWDFYQSNVIGTQHVIQGCQQQGVGRLVYTSTPSVVFGGEDILDGDESLPYPTHYLSYYQSTKSMAEVLVLQANSAGLQTVSLRPHAIWGPGDRHFISSLLRSHQQGGLPMIGNGRNLVSTVYIDNAAEAHRLAAESQQAAGKAYFINDLPAVNLWQWLNEIFAGLKLPRAKRTLPASLLYSVAWLDECFSRHIRRDRTPGLTRYMVSLLSQSHTFKTHRAQADLGNFQIVPHDLGMQRLIEYYQQNKYVWCE